MFKRTMLIFVVAASLLLASESAAETMAWMPPQDMAEQQVEAAPPGITAHRYEVISGSVRRSFLAFDLPKTGGFATTPIDQSARAIAERTGQHWCQAHDLSDWQTWQLDGHTAIAWTMRCVGLVTPGSVDPSQIDYRRNIMIEGDARIYQVQVDAYVAATDQRSAQQLLAFATPLLDALRWCADDVGCAPRASH
jgi:hypothetical protein